MVVLQPDEQNTKAGKNGCNKLTKRGGEMQDLQKQRCAVECQVQTDGGKMQGSHLRMRKLVAESNNFGQNQRMRGKHDQEDIQVQKERC